MGAAEAPHEAAILSTEVEIIQTPAERMFYLLAKSVWDWLMVEWRS